MRRRPSGSGEDEDNAGPTSTSSTSASASTSTKTITLPPFDRSREMTTKEHQARLGGAVSPTGTSQEPRYRNSREMGRSRNAAQWSASSPIRSALEQGGPDSLLVRKDSAESAHEPSTPSPHVTALRSPWRCSFLTLATSLGAIALLITVLHSFLHLQQDPKGCAMSYMIPSFAHMSDFDTEHTRFASKYSLYLYREGGVDDDARVKGIPVLFIPGNAGSYKQVRPIAAEAAHYFQDVLREDGKAVSSGKRPLDFFTVDFNEELIAFHGQTLLDQAEYLNEAVAYILALYHNPQRSARESGLPDPKSVIILGHSMGGIVARAMLRMPNYQDHSINTIVTLAAPHARPPISFDAKMVAIYDDINGFWRRSYSVSSNATSKRPLDDVTLVSVAGGGLDTMISSEYTSVTSLVPDTHGFTVFTSSIPNVWTGMDHLAIMWCDQFRKALVKALFDVVDVRRSSQTRPQAQRVRALRKRLLTGMESVVEKGRLNDEPTVHLTLDDTTTEILQRGQRLSLHSLGAEVHPKAYLMPLPNQPPTDGLKFTLLTDQVIDNDESNGTLSVLLCSVSHATHGASYIVNLARSSATAGSTRLVCKNSAGDVALLPASTRTSVNAFDDARPFSYLQYELSGIADYEFVVVLDKSPEITPVFVIAELNDPMKSTVKVSRGHHQLLVGGLHVSLPADRPMMTELKIPEIHSTLFAYRLEVDRHECRSQPESFAPLLRQHIAEPYESKFFVNTKGGNINVHGVSPYMPPPLRGGGASDGLSLQLWTDPACNSTVDVSLKVDKLGSAGKLVMRYRGVFAAFPLLVVALVLRKQFKVYDSTGVFMSFSQSMDQCIRTSLPAIFIALTFFAIAVSKSGQNMWARDWLKASSHGSEQAIDFTINDLMLGTSDPFFWFLVPLFALTSVGICIVANYAVLVVTHIFSLFYALIHTWTRRSSDDSQRVNHISSFSTTQRLVTLGILILMVTTVIPYQFAYVVLCIVQIATCTRALKTAHDVQSAHNYNFYNYAHSMLVLMLWILPINMPVLVVWIRNLAANWLTPFSTHHNLLSILGYILLVEVMSTNHMIPRVTNKFRLCTNTLIFALALYSAVYGVTYAYCMHNLVNALFLWFGAIHLSSGSFSLASFGQYVTGRGPEQPHVKKRP